MANKRRGAGEGTIYQRKNGRWCAMLTVGYDDRGRQRRKTVYGSTGREVAQKLAALQKDQADGVLADAANLKVGQFLDRWLESSGRSRLRPSTLRMYGGVMSNHIVPRIGGVSLERLTPLHVAELYLDMDRSGASPRLRQITHNLLHGALHQAVKWNLIPRNPTDAVDRPRAPTKEVQYLTSEQVRQLLAAAEGDRFEALFVLAVTTGMRQGELFGLQWQDINFDVETISVRRQLLEHSGRCEFGELKTARSKRRIDVSLIATNALLKHRARTGAIPHPRTLVFTDTRGGPLRKSNVVRRSFHPLLRRAGLPRIRFHDLRHTAATLMLELGVHPRIVQERLGHSSVSLTLDVYSHALPTLQRDAAQRLDTLLQGSLKAASALRVAAD